MKISEFISRLEQLKEICGNVEVVIENRTTDNIFERACSEISYGIARKTNDLWEYDGFDSNPLIRIW